MGVSVVDNGGMQRNVATVFDRWTTSGSTRGRRAGQPPQRRRGGLDLDENDTWIGLLGDPKNRVLDSTFTRGLLRSSRCSTATAGSRPPTPRAPPARSSTNEASTCSPGAPPRNRSRSTASTAAARGHPRRRGAGTDLWNTLVQNEFTGKWVDESSGPRSCCPSPPIMGSRTSSSCAPRGSPPTRFSRLEGALGDFVTGSGTSSILHEDIERPETDPVRTYLEDDLIGKNINEQQVRDIRHRMTLFGSARNEYRPLWLWKTASSSKDLDYDREQTTYLQDCRLRRLPAPPAEDRPPGELRGGQQPRAR